MHPNNTVLFQIVLKIWCFFNNRSVSGENSKLFSSTHKNKHALYKDIIVKWPIFTNNLKKTHIIVLDLSYRLTLSVFIDFSTLTFQCDLNCKFPVASISLSLKTEVLWLAVWIAAQNERWRSAEHLNQSCFRVTWNQTVTEAPQILDRNTHRPIRDTLAGRSHTQMNRERSTALSAQPTLKESEDWSHLRDLSRFYC